MQVGAPKVPSRGGSQSERDASSEPNGNHDVERFSTAERERERDGEMERWRDGEMEGEGGRERERRK